jgi:NAD-dependent SIR2 family protein deacetylase
MHGIQGDKSWAAPTIVTEFDVNCRLTFTDIKAHEYCDSEGVLQEKVRMLANLIRQSTNFIAYTGAGISTAAGIDDYATKAKGASVTADGRPQLKDWKKAKPTKSHFVMTALYESGFLKHWVQQNHDSLPQKAGYPQHALNEIHGSLHDPANPVVPYEGTLRDDLFEWMHQWERRADLCLALGTSLSGFNADSVCGSASERFLKGTGLGLVLVNLQKTPYDESCSLRIYSKIDRVMELLALELGIADRVRPMGTPFVPTIAPGGKGEGAPEDVFLVPFDAEGNPLETQRRTEWDLRLGSRLRLTGGPYEGDEGCLVEKSPQGHYRLRFTQSVHPVLGVLRRPFSLWMGSWWVQQATHGHGIVPRGKLPCVNVPLQQDEDEEECEGGTIAAGAAAALGGGGGGEDLSKYRQLLSRGVPEGAVRQRMAVDGVRENFAEDFWRERASSNE